MVCGPTICGKEMEPGKIEIRQAKHEDYLAVMEICGEVFEGRDCLPHVFHSFLHDKNSLSIVLLYNGRIVSKIHAV